MTNYGDEGLYFLHIPKTAGMTVWKAIASAHAPETICPYWLWDQLLGVPKAELAKFQVFRGHFHGLLEAYLGRKLATFTLLRDPVERTISTYYYIRQSSDHPNHERACELSLLEFCLHEETRYRVENYQAGYLATFVFALDPAEVAMRLAAGQQPNRRVQVALERSWGGIQPDVLLDAAREGLRRLRAAGTVESLEKSMRIAGEALGCRFSLPAERQNVTLKRVPVGELDEATLATIRSITAVDQALYDQVAAAVAAAG